MSERKIACSMMILILSIILNGSGAVGAPSSTPPVPGQCSALVADLFPNSFSGAAILSALSGQMEAVPGSNGMQYRSLSLSNSSATVLCSTHRSSTGKVYISDFFPAGNQDHTTFELAFDNYIYTKLDTQGLGATCVIYPSVAKAKFTLERWKQEEKAGAGSHQLVETGWVYQSPSAGPAPGRSQGL